VAFDFDPDKYRQSQPDLISIKIGLVTADHPGFFEHPYPAQARRRGQPYLFSQLYIAQTAIPLQRCENLAVVGIEFHDLADPDGVLLLQWQIMPTPED
jgi:hypothetical protein